MSDAPERRLVRLLIPDTSDRRIVVDADGGLPHHVIEIPDGSSTMLIVRRSVLPAMGLCGHLIDCFVDPSDVADGVAVPALVELMPPPPDWPLPDGCRWCPVEAVGTPVDDGLPSNIAAHLGARLDEFRGVPAHELRPAWSRRGWYERACAWVDEALVASGRRPATLVEQYRHWGISAVMRVEHPDGLAWFKAAFPPFRQEARISPFLYERAPGKVAPVIASNHDEGWLLLDDLGDETFEGRPADNAAAVRHLVTLQRGFVDHRDDLVATGALDRRFVGLADELATTLAEPAVRAEIAVDPERGRQLCDWVRRAAAEVAGLGIPDTLVHGDFHPGNVALVGGEPVIFDWTDAAISNPFLDVVTWAWWLHDDPGAADDLWPTFVAEWDDIAPGQAVLDARVTLEGLAYAHHAVSYGWILRALEPSRRPENAGGITEFVGKLDRLVPA